MGSNTQESLKTSLPDGHYIAGTWDSGDGEEVFEFFEPCTGTVLGTLPIGTETDVGRAIDSAHTCHACFFKCFLRRFMFILGSLSAPQIHKKCIKSESF